MKKLLLTAAAACALAAPALVAAPAFAEESGISYSGNIALTSDYVFRGVSQTDGHPAVQGGFDASYGQFYAGTWASNVSFPGSSLELDLYAGWKPTLGPVSLDLGVLGYFYPGADDDAAEADYYELKAAGSIAPIEHGTIGAAVFYSPDFYGETDTGLYYELNGSYALSDQVSFSGAVGHQTIDDTNGPSAPTIDGDYTTWNLGATYSISGFAFDLRYTDTDIDDTSTDGILAYTGTDKSNYESKAVFTVKRAL